MTAQTLMIQGTGSGVGKSILTAGLCRHFYRQGLKVAPFKAQNMSLNSFITEEGGELGRAQAYQAEACGLKPQVAMNPILLKPTADNHSQVIVMGRVTENRDAKDYFARHQKHKEVVERAFDSLRQQYELIVLEGAGSPAEINLKQWDLVNMPMAEYAEAPVLIVGDIDRGGVFAWMKGTLDLLTAKERNRVAGFLVNKFRGDPDLLKPGLVQFEGLTGKPVLGVLPYLRDLLIDEEDAIPAWNHDGIANGKALLDVAVIWYPRIANFTDLAPLAADPCVSLRFVAQANRLGNPDCIVLPGSKNTLEDLAYLQTQGLDRAIVRAADTGAMVLGICGGFQMMGKRVRDPHAVESQRGAMPGLGLLDADTVLQRKKTTRQVRRAAAAGPVLPAGVQLEGYEIHMGETRFATPYPPLFTALHGEDPRPLGVTDDAGALIGTYAHGFLDNDGLRNGFLAHVRRRRGLPQPETEFDYRRFREKQLDRLADLVEESIDLERLHAIVSGT